MPDAAHVPETCFPHHEKHPAAGLISRLAAAFVSTGQRLVAPLKTPTTLKGLKATGPFDIAKVVAATLPDGFEAFTPAELSETKRFFEEIRTDQQRASELHDLRTGRAAASAQGDLAGERSTVQQAAEGGVAGMAGTLRAAARVSG